VKWSRAILAIVFMSIALPALAQQSAPEPRTLFTNVHVFDGVNEKRIMNANVLVEGNLIKEVSTRPISAEGATVVDGGGRTLTPGFIDMHYHIAYASARIADVGGPYGSDLDLFGIVAAQEAERVLQRGFTSIRNAMGPGWGVKVAIDRGMVNGPRIWPSLRGISQFGGHVDANPRYLAPREFGGPENRSEQLHSGRIVSGRAQVLAAVRENLKQGASQIKITAGGGYGTEFDPIDGDQLSAEEIRAAVEAAENFGTYVMAHIYTPRGIRIAVENGVKSIEHGNLIDQPTAKLMAKKGVWLSPQVLTYTNVPESLGPVRLAKHKLVYEGLDTMFAAAKKYELKIVFGTDVVFDADAAAKQNTEFTLRTKWFTPAEILRQATSLSGELLQLSGERNPYPGKIGVIEEGALADILLINGNPLENISILTKPEENLALIMKDGVIHKDTIE